MDKARSNIGQFAITPLWLIEVVSPRALQVFATMCAKWVDRETDQCFPHQGTIAEILDVSLLTVNRAISELKDAGALEVEARYDNRGFRSGSLYTINYAKPLVTSQVRQPDDSCITDEVTGCNSGDVTDLPPVMQQREPESFNQNHSTRIIPSSSSSPSLVKETPPITMITPENDPSVGHDVVSGLSYPAPTTTDNHSPHDNSTRRHVDPVWLPPMGAEDHGPHRDSTGRRPLLEEMDACADAMGAQVKPKPKVDDAPDPEVVRLCELLADLYHGLGNTRPNPHQKAWYRDCRLLLTKDGPDGSGWEPEKVELIIRWALQDSFWSSNIRSIPKLRLQFDRLRAARNQDLERKPPTWSSASNTNMAALRARYEAEET